MAIVRPFRAHRPPVSLVARVSCPPYDVINTAEARVLARGDQDSLLRVTRPEIDFPEGTDEHDDRVYAQGRRNLDELIARGTLVPDAVPTYYVYAQRMGTHRQAGVVACVSVDDYERDVIKKHEKTRRDKEDDRTRHIDALGAHDEPVFLTYRAVPAIDQAVARVMRTAPVYDFDGSDGVGHSLWLADPAERDRLSILLADVPILYVADGHHRSASAARVHRARRGQIGEHDVFMAVVFPDHQMLILPYNRVVRDRQGRSISELLAVFRERFEVESAAEPAPREPQSFGLFLGDKWYRLRVRPGSFPVEDPVLGLDVSICQEQILNGIFHITDPCRDQNVDFVGGIRGAAELERRVREQGWSAALFLHPTRVDQLMEVSEVGQLMPPKSTWFEPKLRSGLFLHLF
ncbi:DUF1015 domain-containing protein [Myxococcota bacterium]